MGHERTDLETRLEEQLRRKANELPALPGLPPTLLRRTRWRIVRTVAVGATALGLVGLGAFVTITRLAETSGTMPGGGAAVMDPGEAATPRVTFDGTLRDNGCTFDGPRTVGADEAMTVELENGGEVDFFVEFVSLMQGKTFSDLVAYVDRSGGVERPSWVGSEGALLAVPGDQVSWTRTLAPGDYAVVCFTTHPARLWILAPLTAQG